MKRMEIIEANNKKYLVVRAHEDDYKRFLNAILLANTMPVYWVDVRGGFNIIAEVDSVQTLYGACPNSFAIEIDNSDIPF